MNSVGNHFQKKKNTHTHLRFKFCNEKSAIKQIIPNPTIPSSHEKTLKQDTLGTNQEKMMCTVTPLFPYSWSHHPLRLFPQILHFPAKSPISLRLQLLYPLHSSILNPGTWNPVRFGYSSKVTGPPEISKTKSPKPHVNELPM